MSLFEWLGESHNPGPIGTIDAGSRRRRRRSRLVVLLCAVLAAGLLGFWTFLILGPWQIRAAGALTGFGVGTVLYLLAGYYIHPKPDTSNLGWFGGLIDHPFRYSDDFNRFGIFLLIALLPGRFISESIVDLFSLVLHSGDRNETTDEDDEEE